MAITTYAELKAAVADWADRTDLSTQIPDFITLAEARLNDLLVLKNMESDEPLTATAGQNYITLPTGFISPLAFWLVITGIRVPLLPALPAELPYSVSNSQPQYYAIDGTNLLFDCPAGAAYPCFLRCIKQSNLGASTATNYLLAKRPDIYLAGSMVELARYTRDVDMFNAWETKFLKEVANLKASDSRNRGMSPLRTDVSRVQRRRNIFSGE